MYTLATFPVMGKPQLKDQLLLKKVALKLKALREAKGLSQEQLYNDTDIHVGRIETGRNNISISTLSRLCEYFNISLSDFFKKL